MATPELFEYIKKERLKNISDDKIRESLTANGWKAEDINDGLSNVPSIKGLKEYERIIWGTLFVISYVGYIIFMVSVTDWRLDFDSYSYFVIIGGLLVCLAGSFMGSKDVTPKKGTGGMVVDIISRTIAAIAITAFLWFILFFAWCLYAGMGNL